MASPHPWFVHPALVAASPDGIRTRLGLSPNHASFRIGVLRTHLLTALLANSAARYFGAQVHVTIRWDDSDPFRSHNAHRVPLLREVKHVARIPVDDEDTAVRQSKRGDRHRHALRLLDSRELVVISRGLPCLDVTAVDRYMAAHGACPRALTASAAVNATTALSPQRRMIPLMRSDGRALWHLATVVDDIDQRTNLIVRGADKRDALPIQVRLYWALSEGKHPPAHVFLPKLLAKPTEATRVADLLERGVRPSALRYFLAEPYLSRPRSPDRPTDFSALVGRVNRYLPRYGDSILDERRLGSLDRKMSAALPAEVATEELRDRCPNSPAHAIEWTIAHYPRPLVQQARLCRALTDAAIDYEPPPARSEEACLWLGAWIRGKAEGPPPHPVRWVLTGQRNGPSASDLLKAFASPLLAARLRSARQELRRSSATRRRSKVRSRPSSSRDSKSGRPTVRPVTATRTGA